MMGERILVWGGGGHGKVVSDLVRVAGYEVAGVVDASRQKLGEIVEPGGATVALSEEALLELLASEQWRTVGAQGIALGIGDNHARLRCLEKLREVPAPVLVHPTAAVSASAKLGQATVVGGGAAVNAAAIVGRACIVNTGAVVEHDCVLGDGVHVSPNATLGGAVVAGRAAWIGAGAVVLPGIRIGPGAIVGAGAVVLENVEGGQVVVGNPARVIRTEPEAE